MTKFLIAAFLFAIHPADNAFPKTDSGSVVRWIEAGNLSFVLTYDTVAFFKGNISVTSNKGMELFNATVFYSYCYFDTLADLDKNGSEELILGLATGMSPYQWSKLLIFETSSVNMTPFEVMNGELVSIDGDCFAKATIRMSPSYLGALVYYLLELRNGQLVLADTKENAGAYEHFTESSLLEESISVFESETNECEEDSGYQILFEAYALQAWLSGKESLLHEFFRKKYACDDMARAYETANRFAEENFESIRSADYRFRKD
jgi:hypothetical protein